MQTSNAVTRWPDQQTHRCLIDRMQQGRHRDTAGTADVPVSESISCRGFTEAGFKARSSGSNAIHPRRRLHAGGDLAAAVDSVQRTAAGLVPPPAWPQPLSCIFLDLDDFQVVGSSPEILVRLEDGEVTVRPIAGTRRRGHTEEDLALEAELLADPKELAEHLMLIDLGRNDTGRVAQVGSVKLTDKMVVERYSRDAHRVQCDRPAQSGHDGNRCSARDLSAGTVSGAPKIRAMGSSTSWSRSSAGIYSGAVGYLSWNGNMDTAIAIRTAVIKDGQLHIQAGAGVVADSVPELEWKETMNKGVPCSVPLRLPKPDSTSIPAARRRAEHVADDRQLRFLHVQHRAVLRGARRRGQMVRNDEIDVAGILQRWRHSTW